MGKRASVECQPGFEAPMTASRRPVRLRSNQRWPHSQNSSVLLSCSTAASSVGLFAAVVLFNPARLRITLQDRPGALFKVMHAFNAHHVNIIEIYHQRIFTTLPAKGLITDIECEARDRGQIEALIATLISQGYAVTEAELA